MLRNEDELGKCYNLSRPLILILHTYVSIFWIFSNLFVFCLLMPLRFMHKWSNRFSIFNLVVVVRKFYWITSNFSLCAFTHVLSLRTLDNNKIQSTFSISMSCFVWHFVYSLVTVNDISYLIIKCCCKTLQNRWHVYVYIHP